MAELYSPKSDMRASRVLIARAASRSRALQSLLGQMTRHLFLLREDLVLQLSMAGQDHSSLSRRHQL